MDHRVTADGHAGRDQKSKHNGVDLRNAGPRHQGQSQNHRGRRRHEQLKRDALKWGALPGVEHVGREITQDHAQHHIDRHPGGVEAQVPDVTDTVHQKEESQANGSDGEDRAFGFLPSERDQERHHEEGIDRDGDDEHPVPIGLDVVEHEGDREVGRENAPAVLNPQVDECEVLAQGKEAQEGQDPEARNDGDVHIESEDEEEDPEIRDVGPHRLADLDCASQNRDQRDGHEHRGNGDLGCVRSHVCTLHRNDWDLHRLPATIPQGICFRARRLDTAKGGPDVDQAHPSIDTEIPQAVVSSWGHVGSSIGISPAEMNVRRRATYS